MARDDDGHAAAWGCGARRGLLPASRARDQVDVALNVLGKLADDDCDRRAGGPTRSSRTGWRRRRRFRAAADPFPPNLGSVAEQGRGQVVEHLDRRSTSSLITCSHRHASA